MTNNISGTDPGSYASLIASQAESCVVKTIILDGKSTTIGSSCQDGLGDLSRDATTRKTYIFKSISSVLAHKSPTDEEYKAQLKALTTPSLPSDRDRYVDFLDANLAYKKIVYPNFFRLTLDASELNFS